MKIKTKKVYYCDYCKEYRLTKPSMEKHEKYCTMNQNRECRLCGKKNIYDIIEKYKNKLNCIITRDSSYPEILRLKWTNGKINLDDIRAEVDGCPNCVFTILRITLLNEILCFNYAEELKRWWNEKNDEDYEKEMRELIYETFLH